MVDGDQGAMGGALNLLDGVNSGQADNGGAEFLNGIDCAVDGGRVDQRAHGVVDENDVVRLGGERIQGIGDRLLAVVATFYNMRRDLRNRTLQPGPERARSQAPHGYIDRRHPLHRGKRAQRMDQDGEPREREKLFGLRAGHARAQPGGGKNYEYLHNG